MTSATETFAVTLARASRQANRFLRSRRLDRDDRDDVIAAAMLWCWENRDNYSLTATLEQWFLGAVRNAYQAWRAGESRNAAEYMAEIPTGDTTQAVAEALSSAQALVRALPPEYKRVMKLELSGYTREEMRAHGVADHVITDARARIKQLRKFTPDVHEYRRVLRTPPATLSDDVVATYSQIDKDIAALDFPPPSGKECPPCFYCKWFEGYMPSARKPVRMQITERSVKAAVLWTERRKKRIAQAVRDGTI
jgi:DNA-directed RNA polymerase specialized sigma24 family protein